jgi:hypothetical protein
MKDSGYGTIEPRLKLGDNGGAVFHDAACAHALMREIAVLRDASESMKSAHGRLVLKLLDLLDDRSERLMREWGFDSGEAE